MRIAMLASAGAIAFACTIGSVSAADQSTTLKGVKQFTALNGVKAVPMSSGELSSVKGMDHHFTVTNPGTDGLPVEHETVQHQEEIGPGGKGKNFVDITFSDGVTRSVAPSYKGLMKACGNGVIDGPGFLC